MYFTTIEINFPNFGIATPFKNPIIASIPVPSAFGCGEY